MNVVGLDIKHFLEEFRGIKDDQNLSVSSSQWTVQKKTKICTQAQPEKMSESKKTERQAENRHI
jgi:hypothetical protein